MSRVGSGSRFLLEGWIQIGFLIKGRTQLRGFEVQIRIPTLIMYLAMSCKHLWNACSLQNKTGCSPFARLWFVPFCADTLYTHNLTHKKCIRCSSLAKLFIYAVDSVNSKKCLFKWGSGIIIYITLLGCFYKTNPRYDLFRDRETLENIKDVIVALYSFLNFHWILVDTFLKKIRKIASQF